MEIIYEFLIQPWQEKLSSYFTHHLWTGTLKIKYVKQGGSCPTFPMGKTQGIQSFEIYSNTFESSSFPLAIKCLHKESTHKRWREEKMLHILCCAYFLCGIMLTLFLLGAHIFLFTIQANICRLLSPKMKSYPW